MSECQRWIMIFALASGTLLTRFIPFWFFPENKALPKWLLKLGDTLPYASLGMLLIYALKDVNLLQSPFGASEIIALLAITFTHMKKKNTLISIFFGLVVYLVCVNIIFI